MRPAMRSPSQQFRKWRYITRVCFVLGVVLCIVAQPPGGTRQILLAPGLVLLALTIVFYSRYCGRIERCPFCRETLDGHDLDTQWATENTKTL